jgi:DNA-binding GntR family transcriptional regulator
MLNQEGLVTNKPRSGYFVTPITLKQLCDMLELWKILAVACVERATATITDDQLDVLEHLPRGYIGDDESYDRYIDENRQFYGLIAAATGNQELHNAVGSLHDRLARFIVIRSAGKHTEFTHKRIVEALRTRDVDAARQTMLDELLETRESILNHIISEEGAYWHLR